MRELLRFRSVSAWTKGGLLLNALALALVGGCMGDVGLGEHQYELAAAHAGPSLSRRPVAHSALPTVQPLTPERIGHGWSLPQHPVPDDGVFASAGATGLGGPWSEDDQVYWSDARLSHATATVSVTEQVESDPGAELEWSREEASSHHSAWSSVFGSPTSYLFTYSGHATHSMDLHTEAQDCPIGTICSSYGIEGAGGSGLFVEANGGVDPTGGGTGGAGAPGADEDEDESSTGVTLTVRTAMRFELSTDLRVDGSSASEGGVGSTFQHRGVVSVRLLDEDGGFVSALDGGVVALESSVTVRDDMTTGHITESLTFDLEPGPYTFIIGVEDRASSNGEISEEVGQSDLEFLFEGEVQAEVLLRAIGA